ncbi:hypothetical protein [Streptomyces sp. YU58]|uniref:hypothetical protein n=1 Tax=Streptomyces sp. SX92 TaxID=3158972 RepID=UPI0027BACA1A|nr:hypothetical protein [Streptomyces coralus]WLW58089.1 hypothetical protein QU709_44955 [Streptomyces coralus]
MWAAPAADITSITWDGRHIGSGPTFSVPDDATAGDHDVYVTCSNQRYGQATFTVTNGNTTGETDGNTNGNTTGETDGNTNGNTTGETDGNTNGNTTGETDGSGDGTTGGTDSTTVGGRGDSGGEGTATPVGWVVGPSVFVALLLLALLFSLVSHRQRGLRWGRGHIHTALRPGAGTAELRQGRDGGSVSLSVRLEPHPDPGDQRLS